MRAILWAVIVLAVAVGAAAWWLGPNWTLGQALDRAKTPIASVPSAATAAALVPTAMARFPTAEARPTVVPTPAAGPTVTPDPSSQAITATEDNINAYLSTASYGRDLADTPFGPISVEDMHVRFRPNEIVVTGAARGGPGRLSFTLTGTLVAEDGAVHMIIRDAKVNDLPLPLGMRGAVEQALSTQLAAAMKSEGARVTSVEVADRAVTVRMVRGGR